MNESPPAPVSVRRGVGRPRRLTREAIVDAACEIGLEKLDMCLVAERLKTGVATLYGYVRGRDELARLVVERVAVSANVGRQATSWQEVLREHASVCFHATEERPETLAYFVNEDLGEVESAYAAGVIGQMVSQGLPPDDASLLYVEATQVVIGATMCRARARRIISTHSSRIRFLEGTLGDYRPTLERIIRDYQRGVGDAGNPSDGD